MSPELMLADRLLLIAFFVSTLGATVLTFALCKIAAKGNDA